MERTLVAARRYVDIAPRPKASVGRLEAERLQAWLTNEALPAIETYVDRPRFREYAAWPITTLRSGTGTPERDLIDEIDPGLVRYAKAVSALASRRLVARKLKELFPPRPYPVEETVEISGGGERRLSARYAPVDFLADSVATVGRIAGRDWADLVDVNDYFGPQSRFIKTKKGEAVEFGARVYLMNIVLPPAGDFIGRCALATVEGICGDVDLMMRRCREALRSLKHDYRSWIDAAESSRSLVRSKVAELRTRLFSGRDAKLRDACVCATQVYAAIHPLPILDWLCLDARRVDSDRKTVAGRLSGHAQRQICDQVAAALRELHHLYDGEPDQPVVEEAVATGGLVVVKASGEIYWQGAPLENLGVVPTRLLIALAGKRGRDVDCGDVYKHPRTDSALSTACNRLKNRLPNDLKDLIVCGRKPRSYRLDLHPTMIKVVS